MFSLLWYEHSSAASVLCAKHMCSLGRNRCTLFQSGCTVSHPHQQCVSDLVSFHPHQHLLLSLHLLLAILIGVCLSLLLKNYLSIYSGKAKDKSNKELVWAYRKVCIENETEELTGKSNG